MMDAPTKTPPTSPPGVLVVVDLPVLVLTSLILLIVSTQAAGIVGQTKICEEEGKIVLIPEITDNPCITCICRNREVRCERERCDGGTVCNNLFESSKFCCPRCQGCNVNGTHLEPSRDFLVDQCTVTNCNNGIITRSRRQCHVPCADPMLPEPGRCCPRCKECVYDGRRMSEGDVFSLPGKPCVTCKCESGKLRCFQRVCPVLPCVEEGRRLSEDGCCSVCVGTRRVFLLSDGQCWFQRNILRHDERVRVGTCTACVCLNGTVLCDRVSCPVRLACPPSEQIVLESRCCPVCREDMLEDCSLEDTGGRQQIRADGEKWRDATDSCLLCGCNRGRIICNRTACPPAIKCPEGHVAEHLPGSCCAECVQAPGVCTVFGDPHYVTFDNRQFSYQGDCSYVLSRDCEQRHYSVVVRNDAKRSRSFSWTSSVELTLRSAENFDEKIFSLHQRLVAKLDGKRLELPYVTKHVTIRADKGFLRLRTARGIWLDWDGDNYLAVFAMPRYRDLLCGLCGNYNGFDRDDFVGSDGYFKSSVSSFADTWTVPGSECTRPDYEKKLREPCDVSLSAKLRSRKKCSVFKSASFQVCYKAVNPETYYKSCLMDTCNCYWDQSCACESVKAYAIECARHRVSLTLDLGLYCKKTCRKGKVYSPCGPACQVTCRNYRNKKRQKRCSGRPCVAGCHCPVGYVIRRGRCIKTTQCHSRERNKSRRVNKRFKQSRRRSNQAAILTIPTRGS